jgi:hypothetical protein
LSGDEPTKTNKDEEELKRVTGGSEGAGLVDRRR